MFSAAFQNGMKSYDDKKISKIQQVFFLFYVPTLYVGTRMMDTQVYAYYNIQYTEYELRDKWTSKKNVQIDQ